MADVNQGFDPAVIKEYQEKMKRMNKNYFIIESDDNTDDYVNFFFVSKYKGKPVIVDAVIYTLRLHHDSELYEIAEHRAAKHFPDFKKIKYKEDENGDLAVLDALEEEIGLYMAEVMMELEAEEEIKVKEHVIEDPHLDFGIGMDIALNVEWITQKVISQFVEDYNTNTLHLDETLYSFETEDDGLIK